MPLGAGNIIQSNSGNNSAAETTSLTVSVSGATSANAVIIGVVTAGAGATPPDGFVVDAHAQATTNVNHYVFRRQVSFNETSWVVTLDAGVPAAWWVLEVFNLNSTPFLVGTSNSNISAGSISTLTTPEADSNDIMCLASFQSYNTSNTTITWSGYTNSFTEVKDQSTASSGSTETSTAVAYLFPGAIGSYTTTATLSASAACSAVLVIYQAAPAPTTSVDTVPIGGYFPIVAKVNLRDGSGTHMDLFTDDDVPHGGIVVASNNVVTGSFGPTATTPATLVSQPFNVGAIVRSDTTGETMVVVDSWIDSGGAMWSSTLDRSVIYSTSGWSLVGAATLN